MMTFMVSFRVGEQFVFAHWNAKINTFLCQIAMRVREGVEIRQAKPHTKMLNCWQTELNKSSPLSECHEYGLLCLHSWSCCSGQRISDVGS